jgi:hypothetical protein
MNDKDKINKLEARIVNLEAELKSRITGLEIDIDDLLSRLEAITSSSKNMRDIMEEVAKLANQPVGMMFDYRA